MSAEARRRRRAVAAFLAAASTLLVLTLLVVFGGDPRPGAPGARRTSQPAADAPSVTAESPLTSDPPPRRRVRVRREEPEASSSTPGSRSPQGVPEAVSAVVLLHDGRPLSNALVVVRLRGDPDAPPVSSEPTGADGRFARPPLDDRRYDVHVHLDGSTGGIAFRVDGADPDWELDLNRPHAVGGHVFAGRPGVPVQGAVITARSGDDSFRARSDGKGAFLVRALRAGKFTVEAAWKPPGYSTDRTVTLSDVVHDTLDLELRFPAEPRFFGRLVDDSGRPLSGDFSIAVRSLRLTGENGRSWGGTVKQDGTFRVDGVSSDDNVVWVWPRDKDSGLAMTVLHGMGRRLEPQDVTIVRGGRIAGVAAVGSGANVGASGHWFIGEEGGPLQNGGSLTQGGEFRSYPLPVGPLYDVVIVHGGHSGTAWGVGAGTVDLVVPMRKTAPITGRVVAPDGSAVRAGVRVLALNTRFAARRVGLHASVQSDADGNFRFEGLADLDFTLSAAGSSSSPHGAAAAPGVFRPGDSAVIRMAPGGRLSGRIELPDGIAQKKRTLKALPPSGQAWECRGEVALDGTFDLGGLPVGRVRLSLAGADTDRLIGEFEVPATGLRLDWPGD